MSRLYVMPHYLLLAFLMLLSFSACIQTLGIAIGFKRFNHDRRIVWENLLEVGILLNIFTLICVTAEILKFDNEGYVYRISHNAAMYAVFLMILATAIITSNHRRTPWPMTAVLASALTIPIIQKTAGVIFPWFYVTAVIFWAFRSVHFILLRNNEYKNELSILSIKEAVDSLDTGVLFYLDNGQIVLQNKRMQEIMAALKGGFQYNGKDFHESLVSGDVVTGCIRENIGSQLAYHLNDGTVWAFEQRDFEDRHQKYHLITASDTTERWKAAARLMVQNRELEIRNAELRELLQNLETICKTEETIRAKNRVHDVLGQRISLLIRALREHKEPDEVLLASFAKGLPEDFTPSSSEAEYSLDTLVKVFEGLGVAINVTGSLPESENIAKAYSEIAAEAITNAVRHGYASSVDIVLKEADGYCLMDITDSGIPSEAPVTEGGGLKGMRRRINELGGKFFYEQKPHFHISTSVPENMLNN